jgi:hypothetical protein
MGEVAYRGEVHRGGHAPKREVASGLHWTVSPEILQASQPQAFLP